MSDDLSYLEAKEEYLKTLNVGQLIEILKKYPDEMFVMTTWESTIHALIEENIYESYTGRLYLDADENFYKKDFERVKDD